MTSRAERRTEARNPRARGLARASTRALLELMNEEDAAVPAAVRAAIPQIERAVEAAVAALGAGGRLRYVGAGTSGRLGVLDASEAPPTFGVEPEMVKGIIAGGDTALRSSIEGAEDDPSAGERDVLAEVRPGDVVVGISASGGAPYVLGAVAAAARAGCVTVGLTCDPDSPLAASAAIPIVVETGPEVLAGSTRLKSGTGTKLVLNMLSTATMVKLGRTRGDLMASLRPTNSKLRERAVSIVATELDTPPAAARARLERSGWDLARALEEDA